MHITAASSSKREATSEIISIKEIGERLYTPKYMARGKKCDDVICILLDREQP